MTRPTLAIVVALAAAAACGDKGPTHTTSPRLTVAVVSGAVASDSVGATFARPLVVEVHDRFGGPLIGVPAEFVVHQVTNSAQARDNGVQIAQAGGSAFADSVEVPTDRQGRAAVMIRAGTVVQTAIVVVDVFGVSTTAAVTVLPSPRASR